MPTSRASRAWCDQVPELAVDRDEPSRPNQVQHELQLLGGRVAETCTGAIGTWNDVRAGSIQAVDRRWMAVSFPGITEEDRITVSPGWSFTHRCSCEAIRETADSGSPCDPVEHTTTRARIEARRASSIGTMSSLRHVEEPEARAAATLWCMLRPRNATPRSAATRRVHHLLDPVDVAREAGHHHQLAARRG